MDWESLDFSSGIAALHSWNEAERERQRAAALKLERLSALVYPERPACAELAAIAAEVQPRASLWMQIVGFNPWTARAVGPVERHEGIWRLLSVMRTVFEVEWKQSKVGRENSQRLNPTPDPSLLTERGDISFTSSASVESSSDSPLIPGAQTTARLGPLSAGEKGLSGAAALGLVPFYDPLVSICFYLGIARSRLSALCLEVTGISILEFLDCVRVRGLRGSMMEALRPMVSEWLEYLSEQGKSYAGADWHSTGGAFLKWVRGLGRGVALQQWAWSLGIPTRSRISKAVFCVEGVTMEELEFEIVLQVLKLASSEQVERPTMENSVMMESLGARSAEKADPCSESELRREQPPEATDAAEDSVA